MSKIQIEIPDDGWFHKESPVRPQDKQLCLVIPKGENYVGIKTRDEIEAGTKMTENLADIAVTVGGESGADKVMNTVHKYNELNS